MKKWVNLLLVLLAAPAGYAQLFESVTRLTASPREYEKMEWDITLGEQVQNPYNQQEVNLDLMLAVGAARSGSAARNAGAQRRSVA